MAEVTVEYTVKLKTTIIWPDDEIDEINHDTLMDNISFRDDDLVSYLDVTDVMVDASIETKFIA